MFNVKPEETICPNCKETDVDFHCIGEAFETTGELMCDVCFESYCERMANTPENEKTCGHDQWLSVNGL